MSEREGRLELRGYGTWYRVVGDADAGADPLVCLHGGPGSTHHYFAPLERLAHDGRQVVVYDQLGCGGSDRPTGVEWTLQVFVDELAELRSQLGLERIHLLGTSWGGMLALEHALSGYGGLASLVLSSTLASAEEWAVEVKRLRDELDGSDDDVMAAFEARHFYRGETVPPELERMSAERGSDVYRAMWGPNEWTITGALRGWDVRARLHEIHVPTLVIRGRYDLCTERIAAMLVRGVPNAREVVFEHSSHTPVLEETERYLDVVGGFLRRAEGSVPDDLD